MGEISQQTVRSKAGRLSIEELCFLLAAGRQVLGFSCWCSCAAVRAAELCRSAAGRCSTRPREVPAAAPRCWRCPRPCPRCPRCPRVPPGAGGAGGMRRCRFKMRSCPGDPQSSIPGQGFPSRALLRSGLCNHKPFPFTPPFHQTRFKNSVLERRCSELPASPKGACPCPCPAREVLRESGKSVPVTSRRCCLPTAGKS